MVDNNFWELTELTRNFDRFNHICGKHKNLSEAWKNDMIIRNYLDFKYKQRALDHLN